MKIFKLGRASKRHLEGVNPKLVHLVEKCIKITPVDFTILATGGLRTTSAQMALFRGGASKLDGRNKKSKHQKQPDGFGHAVDLVPYLAGSPRWEWPLIYPLAATMAILAAEEEIELIWGGVWDKKVSDYVKNERDATKVAAKMRAAVQTYMIRHPGPDFIDGPHWQLC